MTYRIATIHPLQTTDDGGWTDGRTDSSYH